MLEVVIPKLDDVVLVEVVFCDDMEVVLTYTPPVAAEATIPEDAAVVVAAVPCVLFCVAKVLLFEYIIPEVGWDNAEPVPTEAEVLCVVPFE